MGGYLCIFNHVGEDLLDLLLSTDVLPVYDGRLQVDVVHGGGLGDAEGVLHVLAGEDASGLDRDFILNIFLVDVGLGAVPVGAVHFSAGAVDGVVAELDQVAGAEGVRLDGDVVEDVLAVRGGQGQVQVAQDFQTLRGTWDGQHDVYVETTEVSESVGNACEVVFAGCHQEDLWQRLGG